MSFAFEYEYVSLIRKAAVGVPYVGLRSPSLGLLVLRCFSATPQAGEGLMEHSLRPESCCFTTPPIFSIHLLQSHVPSAWGGGGHRQKTVSIPDLTSHWGGSEARWWRGSWGGSLWSMWEPNIFDKESLASCTPPAPAGHPRHASSLGCPAC